MNDTKKTVVLADLMRGTRIPDNANTAARPNARGGLDPNGTYLSGGAVGSITTYANGRIAGHVWETIELYKPAQITPSAKVDSMPYRAAMTGGYFVETRPVVEVIKEMEFDAPAGFNPDDYSVIPFKITDRREDV